MKLRIIRVFLILLTMIYSSYTQAHNVNLNLKNKEFLKHVDSEGLTKATLKNAYDLSELELNSVVKHYENNKFIQDKINSQTHVQHNQHFDMLKQNYQIEWQKLAQVVKLYKEFNNDLMASFQELLTLAKMNNADLNDLFVLVNEQKKWDRSVYVSQLSLYDKRGQVNDLPWQELFLFAKTKVQMKINFLKTDLLNNNDIKLRQELMKIDNYLNNKINPLLVQWYNAKKELRALSVGTPGPSDLNVCLLTNYEIELLAYYK